MFPGFAGADVAVQDGAERAMDVTDVGFIKSRAATYPRRSLSLGPTSGIVRLVASNTATWIPSKKSFSGEPFG